MDSGLRLDKYLFEDMTDSLVSCNERVSFFIIFQQQVFFQNKDCPTKKTNCYTIKSITSNKFSTSQLK